MDSESKAALERILAKEPHELLPEEIVILKARSSYLDSHQLSKFASVLGGVQAPPVPPPVTPQQTTDQPSEATPPLSPSESLPTYPPQGTQYTNEQTNATVNANESTPTNPGENPTVDNGNKDPDFKG